MISTLIFDFGDVFINLNKQGAMNNALKLFNLSAFEEDMRQANMQYEIGAISTSQFLSFYKTKFPALSDAQIIHAWNFIIKDFPNYRLNFAKKLSKDQNFKLILLSNTNAMHIDYIKDNVSFYEDFKSCFDAFYLSHKINLRKPNSDIYQFVLETNHLKSDECLFIDDTKENTDTAKSLGIHTWNIDETKEDVVDLFRIKKHLF
ncbi:MAG: HAD family phosphatase [Winogradskyella sp.]|uniref:HAD family hydrolase n=1 Tax=Winogradskyella sp. TaxID=1883156 RepID=UPI0018173CD1|nr:HAD family phosphatase [Winogradskyella sp.]MBT8245827.1 HAD family phosphatase [Winogradskyella sp.]NNK22598.1 HAD family phosphatase [Winogradskyella sp.]